MPIYTLQCEMLTDQTLQKTFEVFESPYNLAKITPPWLNFRIISESVEMRKGAEIDYVIKWLGMPLKWKTVIEEYQPPHLFVDQQAKGPYTLWRHQHTFKETSEGTRVGDRVDYALPLGSLGQIAHGVVVKRQLLEIFNYRQKALAKLLGGRTRTTVSPNVAVSSRIEAHQ